MKICSVCSLTKSEEDFFFRSKAAGKLHSQCKSCYVLKRRDKWKEYYYRYGSEYRLRAVERNRKIKNALRKRMLEYLNNKHCVRCGMNDIRALEFDHIDPTTKSFSIARAIADTIAWEKILQEISKCQILCANCHKIKTAEEQGWYKN